METAFNAESADTQRTAGEGTAGNGLGVLLMTRQRQGTTMTPARAFDRLFDEMLAQTGWVDDSERIARLFVERLGMEGDDVRRLVGDAVWMAIAICFLDRKREGTAGRLDACAPAEEATKA
jgi:hypothetical protein